LNHRRCVTINISLKQNTNQTPFLQTTHTPQGEFVVCCV
jgi:hypothetical protein